MEEEQGNNKYSLSILLILNYVALKGLSGLPASDATKKFLVNTKKYKNFIHHIVNKITDGLFTNTCVLILTMMSITF